MTATPKTYDVRTHGCQMNVHDSERLAGLLEQAGYVAAGERDTADLVVFNTCAVRENADNRLYGTLGHLAPVKAAHPGMQIAVGGCLAQKDGAYAYKNEIPMEIVRIFEKHGFIWGGKWHHYDTMHFEYRPELLGAGG